ncbi:2-keto-4-pentenoate hydratase [Streptomyces sp. NBC_00370]|uniref:2-keto-4-pentenoate hydratase n=1 Tax=Streptomyces sp. NBC_00370 TaxID=2975728 RepID=UPI002E257627
MSAVPDATESGGQPDRAAAARALYAISRGELVEGRAPAELLAYEGQPVESGLPLQLAVLDLWRAAGEEQGGWKVAWTSRGARDRGGKDFRPFGFILAGRIHASGERLDASAIPNGAVEAEICLTIGEHIGGAGVTPEQARAAVRAVAPSFEIISRRLPEGVSMPVRIGNGMNNWGLVVGEEHSPDSLDLDALSVELRKDGELLGTGTAGPDVLDDPYVSLARVCAVLHRQGLALEPGQRIITGSLLPGEKIGQAKSFEARFGGLGSVVVDFG